MQSNLEKYKKGLERLVKKGDLLLMAMQNDCFPEQISEALGDKAKEYIKSLPKFNDDYQAWYSEAKVVIKQLLPDRLSDFERHYEKPKPKKHRGHVFILDRKT
jgi:hypothetical protein